MDNFITSYLQVQLLNNLQNSKTYFEIGLLLIAFMFMNINLTNYFDSFKKYLFSNSYPEITLYCEEIMNFRGTRIKGSDTFKAMLVHIKKKISENNVNGLNKIREYHTFKDYDDFDPHSNEPIIFMSNQVEIFKLIGSGEPNINFKLEYKDQENNKDEDTKVKSRMYELKLIGNNDVTLKILQDYVENKLKEYKEYLEVNDDNLYVFEYSGSDNDNPKISFKKNPFFTTCSMQTLFFENKNFLIEKINFFVNNKHWYERKGKPYTLGLCTYGPPGCGKTSFEKALAKMLDRHLIIVDLSKIKTIDDANSIFFSEKINDRKIPYDKRIYIFPDFDCQSEITKKRSNEEEELVKEDQGDKKDNLIIINQDQSQKLINSLMEKEKQEKLNLSKLLNILDGIPERTGQIIIFNTNHPENLDSALLRPGRMDLMIKFDKINIENTIKMMENFYDCEYENKSYPIPDKRFTPAEFFKILNDYPRMEEALHDIENWEANITEI